MKYVIIGDIHGRTQWKQIIEKEKDTDKFIFLGDYFDPYDWTLTLDDLVNNFRDILDFKIKDPDKFILLVGNHDLAAFESNANHCRYVDGTYENIAPIFYNAIKEGIIQLCYFINNDIVCSHAGFSKTWLDDAGLSFDEFSLNKDFKEQVENKTVISTYDFIYSKGDFWVDGSGDNIWQSPLWIRPNSLIRNKPNDVIQCIGHTRIYKNTNQLYKLDRVKVLLCDCLEHGEYYSYENGEFKFNKI